MTEQVTAAFNRAKQNQHYVPRLLLRNFASNQPAKRGKEKIWVYDKKTHATFNPNIKKIAAGMGYYESELLKEIKLERGLGYIEDAAAGALTRILEERSLRSLKLDERTSLAVFSAAQFLRVQAHRDRVAQMNSMVEDKIRSMGGDPTQVRGWSPMATDDVKAFSIEFLIENLSEFSEQFLNKTWILLQSAKGHSFCIGDNPITLHNRKDYRPYGNLGLGVVGIEIYFPVSPHLTLAMYHPSILTETKSSLQRAQRARARLGFDQLIKTHAHSADISEGLAAAERVIQSSEELLAGATEGKVVSTSADNVTFMNSLQIGYASRFVMSPVREFSLVEQMLADGPSTYPSLKI